MKMSNNIRVKKHLEAKSIKKDDNTKINIYKKRE